MPSFTSQVPDGQVASVRIIDSTSKINKLPVKALMEPALPGFDILPELPTWSFLVESSRGRRVLFDLGVPTDWKDMAPVVVKRLTSNGWDIEVSKTTVDILKDQNISPESIEATIISHHHWDHWGQPGTFPPSTNLIVGPGFKEEQLPAYPSNPNANIRESDFEGRDFVEVSFNETNALSIGPFRALDYFEDGSFYLLDTPGHTTGHISGLARTTNNPSTFIFMGGDLTHHSGELRPSPFLPLPDSIPASIIPALCKYLAYTTACPGSIFDDIQTERQRTPSKTTPFFDPAMGQDIPTAIETIKKAQQADGDENVWYVFAHDNKIRGVADLFPQAANDWKQKGWRETLLWRFLEDFEEAAKQAKTRAEQEGSK